MDLVTIDLLVFIYIFVVLRKSTYVESSFIVLSQSLLNSVVVFSGWRLFLFNTIYAGTWSQMNCISYFNCGDYLRAAFPYINLANSSCEVFSGI